ncbi:pseudouridine synthase [Methanosarcina sp. KYL-1]|uniref:PUA domain-containing protein n=1 Tax=Methanosarcina sp. KYL-1 TaxID=2602068 RepID=UPI002100C2E0|nr:PUA domain-containing protein [Methanosarcina sp. KYL-1]MCQ1537098.1 pseudouridine synthase [Methanosarcina sp. KYL-1]
MDSDKERLSRVRMIADYQFGKGAGKELFPDGATFQLSRTKRVRQVFHSGKRIATARAKDGFFTLSMEAASVLHGFLPEKKLRVTVCEDAAPFIAKGKTAFAKHVVELDPDIRAGEEVLVTDKAGRLLATGQLLLSPAEIRDLENGPAVDVRVGIESKREE